MKLHINGHHVNLTDGLKEKVETSVQKIERHFNQITNVYVILNVEGTVHKAEGRINLGASQNEIFAQADDTDMYKSIDSMVRKLDRQLIKIKEKLQKHNDK